MSPRYPLTPSSLPILPWYAASHSPDVAVGLGLGKVRFGSSMLAGTLARFRISGTILKIRFVS